MKTIALIIQGNLHNNSLNNLNNYLNLFDEIIISYWSDNDETELLLNKNAKIKFIKNLKKDLSNTTINYGNVYFQSYTTLMGLKNTNCDFAIKVRSDDSFGDLSPFINKVLECKKIICSDRWFRPDNIGHYHISDQIIGGETKKLIHGFERTIFRLENQSYYLLNEDITYHEDTNKEIIKNYDHCWYPECIIGSSFVQNIYKNSDVENAKKYVKEIFDIVPLSVLGAYYGKHGTNAYHLDGPSIQSIEDL